MSFRICVIGCGSMSTSGHGPSIARYAATHPDTTLAACCDLDPAKARKYRDQFGFARCGTDMMEMLSREKPDAVCLIAPVSLTCELTCRILDLGYPLIMEKPPGLTVAETDRMLAVADRTGVPHQVAFNRRYAPLVRELKQRVAERFRPDQLHHLRYDFVRVGRVDADFSTTAIHGIDTVRFLAGSDYRRIRFHYQSFPHLGPAVANILMDCELASGATAILSFCPVAGVVIERATVHLQDHTLFLDVPIWNACDSPGRLRHLEKSEVRLDVTGNQVSDGPEWYELSGFYGENAAFFDDLRAGRRPAGDLRSARQSVAVMQCLRERRLEYCA